jgi:hypothetical protein
MFVKAFVQKYLDNLLSHRYGAVIFTRVGSHVGSEFGSYGLVPMSCEMKSCIER